MQETHGKWALTCRAPATDGAAKCAVSQTIFNKASRRRVLAISLSPEAGGGVKGALAMPFGLALAKGVTLQIDGGAVATAEPFYTCLPAGCLVSINWPEATVKALRSATVLKLAAAGLLGRPAEFALTMTGFGGALDRAIELGLVK